MDSPANNNPGEHEAVNENGQLERVNIAAVTTARISCSAPWVSKSTSFGEDDTIPSESSCEEVDDDALDEQFVYFEEDAADKNFSEVLQEGSSTWWCTACGRKFANPYWFVSHQRRHAALELFRCPTCEEGFVALNLCNKHEMKKHGKKSAEVKCGSGQGANIKADKGTSSPASSVAGTESMDADSDEDEGCHETSRSIPSTSLQPYRGPPVKAPEDALNIERKFGNHRRPIVENFRRLI